jgi:hypothetical protein
MDAVMPTRELFCVVAWFGTPFRLVVPPRQKLASSETQRRGPKS